MNADEIVKALRCGLAEKERLLAAYRIGRNVLARRVARLREQLSEAQRRERAAREEICRKCLRVPCATDCEWREPQEAVAERTAT